jgi:hypothetical protein
MSQMIVDIFGSSFEFGVFLCCSSISLSLILFAAVF